MPAVDVAALTATAAALCRPGRGILASDESTGTLGKRLAGAGVSNTPENRRAYRELFYTAPGIEEGLSGAILFHEAVYQATSAGVGFVDTLRDKGILVGIKLDRGLVPLVPPSVVGGGGEAGRETGGGNTSPSSAETTTSGLDGLADRCAAYYDAGVRFAKWRCLLRISPAAGHPSALAISDNAVGLARYARIAQAAGLVPIIEPEIAIDGSHDAAVAAAVTEEVLSVVYRTLQVYGVVLEGTLLKPQMVLPGMDHPAFAGGDVSDVAELTLRTLRRTVPPAVPGIMFLSGGQSEARATACLAAINRAACGGGGDEDGEGGVRGRSAPWALSFSFGRALQSSVLSRWVAGDAAGASRLATALAVANGRATLGEDGNRGFRDGTDPDGT
ncbi:hypothetical protein MMPV_000733 [Pyropia vietnamensis]